MGKSKKKPAWVIAQQANKPKVPLPPGMTKNMMKPTGFEDYFTEAPLTPAEHVEERKMYDPEERFDHRLQTAIYRYTQRRKFHQSYANIFEMFLKYGGVDTGPNQHVGGVSEQELEDYTAQELAMIKCRYQVGDDKDPDEGKWVVDFEGVAKGFL